jgi:uncharacterized protein YcbX
MSLRHLPHLTLLAGDRMAALFDPCSGAVAARSEKKKKKKKKKERAGSWDRVSVVGTETNQT